MVGVPDEEKPVAVRLVDDVETLRVLADPTRIAILRTLTINATTTPPVMSAKELAAALTEPQTKLYRHLKQLEEAGLIVVAETRMVSGILEQRYRTAQLGIAMSRDLVNDPAYQSEFAATISASLDDFRNETLGDWRAGRVWTGETGPESLGMILAIGQFGRMSRPRAVELRNRLAAIMDEYSELPDDVPDGVAVRMLIGWYAMDGGSSTGESGS
jgi:DNA-binding transcriptional ArsR family regulator